MTPKTFKKLIPIWGAIFLLFVSGLIAQQTGFEANDFKAPEHYPPPNQTRLKSLTTGKKAVPQPNGKLLINGLKIETFPEKGPNIPEMVVEAPQCVFDPKTLVASSPGPLQIHSGDGKMRIAGEGFLWLAKTNSSLTISNKTHTTIEKELLNRSATNNTSTSVTSPLSKTNTSSGTNQPLQVDSDHFFFDRQSNLITYTGNVHVEDGQIILICEVMTIQRTQTGKIENIVADRNVVIINKATAGRTTGDHAVYTAQDGRQLVELSGNPHWQEGLREGTATLFIFDRLHNTLRAQGDAYLKLPRDAISQSGILLTEQAGPATNAILATNKFVEMYADSILFQLPPTNGPVQSISAERNVVIVDRENKSRATGGHAFYSESAGRLELTESPLWQAGERLAKADILIFDRNNKTFSARTNAYLKFPLAALGSTNPLAAQSSKTNNATIRQFAEVLCNHYDYKDDLLTFHDNVQAGFVEGEVIRGTLSSMTLKIAYRSNQVHSILAETNVYARQLPIPNVHGTSVEKELKCEILNIRMRTNSLIEQIVAEQNVVATKTVMRTNSPKPIRLELTSEVITADFLPNTNAVQTLVADRHVVITREGTLARGAKAVYTSTNAMAELTGNPVIVSTNGTSTGDIFVLDVRNNKLFNKNYGIVAKVKTNAPAASIAKPATTPHKRKRHESSNLKSK